MARILVGIPTRNRPDLVKEAVRSVLDQSMPDFRLIVSENPGRPEASAEVSAWIASLGDPRVSYVLQALDGGEYGQGRYLHSQCAEPFLCILHDDDLMQADYLEQALGVLERHGDIALYGSSQMVIDRSGATLPELTESYSRAQGRDRFPEGRMSRFVEPLLEFGLFSISGAVFRNSALKASGVGDPDLGGLFPFEFNIFLRVAERGFPAWYSPARRISYRWHDSSIRHSEGSNFTRYMVEDMVRILERRRFEGREEFLRRRLLAYNKRNLAYILLVAGEHQAGLRHLVEAVRLHPQGRSLWAYLAGALLAPRLVRRRWASRVNLAPPQPSWQQAIPAVPDAGVQGEAADRASARVRSPSV